MPYRLTGFSSDVGDASGNKGTTYRKPVSKTPAPTPPQPVPADPVADEFTQETVSAAAGNQTGIADETGNAYTPTPPPPEPEVAPTEIPETQVPTEESREIRQGGKDETGVADESGDSLVPVETGDDGEEEISDDVFEDANDTSEDVDDTSEDDGPTQEELDAAREAAAAEIAAAKAELKLLQEQMAAAQAAQDAAKHQRLQEQVKEIAASLYNYEVFKAKGEAIERRRDNYNENTKALENFFSANFNNAAMVDKFGWTGGAQMDSETRMSYLQATINADMYSRDMYVNAELDNNMAIAREYADLKYNELAMAAMQHGEEMALMRYQIDGVYMSPQIQDMLSEYQLAIQLDDAEGMTRVESAFLAMGYGELPYDENGDPVLNENGEHVRVVDPQIINALFYQTKTFQERQLDFEKWAMDLGIEQANFELELRYGVDQTGDGLQGGTLPSHGFSSDFQGSREYWNAYEEEWQSKEVFDAWNSANDGDEGIDDGDDGDDGILDGDNEIVIPDDLTLNTDYDPDVIGSTEPDVNAIAHGILTDTLNITEGNIFRNQYVEYLVASDGDEDLQERAALIAKIESGYASYEDFQIIMGPDSIDDYTYQLLKDTPIYNKANNVLGFTASSDGEFVFMRIPGALNKSARDARERYLDLAEKVFGLDTNTTGQYYQVHVDPDSPLHMALNQAYSLFDSGEITRYSELKEYFKDYISNLSATQAAGYSQYGGAE